MDAETGHSFWYEIWPHILFYALTDRYPGTGRMEAILRATADRWAEACRVMRGDGDVPDLDHTAFDFQRMRPVDNGRWKEPDAAAGIAWLEYVAWTRTGNPVCWPPPRAASAFWSGVGRTLLQCCFPGAL